MKTLLLLCLLCLTSVASKGMTVVNAASGKPEIAPESLALITDLSLNLEPESAGRIKDLPYTLAGVVVTVNNFPAQLRFVGNNEILFLVPRVPTRWLSGRFVTVEVRQISQLPISTTVAFRPYSLGIYCIGNERTPECLPQGLYWARILPPSLIDESPVPLSRADIPVTVMLFVTGLRGAPKSDVKVSVCGASAQIVYVGPYPLIDGVDTVAFNLPTMRDKECLETKFIQVTVGSHTANAVWLNLGEPRQ